jgi:hypothetical protein
LFKKFEVVTSAVEKDRGAQHFKDSRSHFEIAGTRRVMKQVPYCGPTNIRHHHKKFSWHINLVPMICAPLDYDNTEL